MAKKKFEKDSTEWSMFVDFWSLCQNYWLVERNNEAYWSEAIEAVSEFLKKYHIVPLAHRLGVAFLGYLEEESRK